MRYLTACVVAVCLTFAVSASAFAGETVKVRAGHERSFDCQERAGGELVPVFRDGHRLKIVGYRSVPDGGLWKLRRGRSRVEVVERFDGTRRLVRNLGRGPVMVAWANC